MDIKVIIAVHKPYWMPMEGCYLPLHVGKEGKSDLGFIGDNTGKNISFKNANYCELTGIYWAWKNLKADYIGLCHYRRYFAKNSGGGNVQKKRESIFTAEDYRTLLQKYDVIVPKKRNYYIETVRSQYEHAHNKFDLDEAEKILNQFYPEYSEAFNKVMGRKKLHLYNMFVMEKKLYDSYCSWLFTILFELEKRTDVANYNQYEARVFGFLSERLFNVWLEKRNLKKKEVNVVFLEKQDWMKKGSKFLVRKFGVK